MDIFSLGLSSFRIKGKSASIVSDPFDSRVTGLKYPKVEADIVTISGDQPLYNQSGSVSGDFMMIDRPGEYEIKGVEIIGIRHDNILIYHFKIDNLIVVHLGGLGTKLNDKEKEMLNGCDILFVPVGGNGVLTAEDASQVISQIEPSVIIPMHYKTAKMSGAAVENFTGVDMFLKQAGKEGLNPLPKFNISRDKLPAEPLIIVLE